jgi:3,4-dihydroxy 2-butanone 4-phosphate synthase/GTP cyclohydrolase II
VLIMLRKPHALEATADPKKAPQPLESGDGERHQSALVRMQRWREVGVGAQILRDLGIRSIALMTSQPRQYVGLGGFGIEITDTIVLK